MAYHKWKIIIATWEVVKCSGSCRSTTFYPYPRKIEIKVCEEREHNDSCQDFGEILGFVCFCNTDYCNGANGVKIANFGLFLTFIGCFSYISSLYLIYLPTYLSVAK